MERGSSSAGGDLPRDYRIAVVDDHPITRRGLCDLIAIQPGLTVCCEAGNLDDADSMITQRKPNLVLLDLMLGRRSALSLLSRVKQAMQAPRVLVLTFLPEDIYGERAFAAGADGFISKDEPSESVLRGIRTIQSGEQYFSERLRERMKVMPARANGDGVALLQSLTKRELEIFELLSSGLNSKQIAVELDISPKTVETHVAHLKEKFSATSGAELSRKAILWKASQT